MSTNGNGKLQSDRWDGIERVYSTDDVRKLKGTVEIEHTLARLGAERLWTLLHEREYLPTLYQFDGRWVVDDTKFRAAFGDGATPLDDALDTTLGWFRDASAPGATTAATTAR